MKLIHYFSFFFEEDIEKTCKRLRLKTGDPAGSLPGRFTARFLLRLLFFYHYYYTLCLLQSFNPPWTIRMLSKKKEKKISGILYRICRSQGAAISIIWETPGTFRRGGMCWFDVGNLSATMNALKVVRCKASISQKVKL